MTTFAEGNARNLALRSGGTIIDNLDGTSPFGYKPEYTYFNINAFSFDETVRVTISFDLVMTVAKANPSLTVYNSNRIGPMGLGSVNALAGETHAVGETIEKRVAVTMDWFPRQTPSLQNNFVEFYSVYDSGNYYSISNLMVELGEVAHPWRAAPEDLSGASDMIIATDTRTLAVAVDVQKVETFYYQTASTASAPSRPTTASPSGWQATEFAFDATKAVWSCQKTTLTDGTFYWGEVSKWSAYEGAVASKNAADAAQATANSANGRAVACRGVCSTAAGTAAKVVASANFVLAQGATVTVHNTTAQTYAGAITLNVNDTGAKTVYVAGAATSDANRLLWAANSSITFTYDGTYWRVEDNPGTWYGTACGVAAGTAAKTTEVAECVLFKGAKVSVPMTYANTASATLNVTSLGATAIRYGSGTAAPTTANGYGWKAGSTCTFAFDGKFWRYEEAQAMFDAAEAAKVAGNYIFDTGGNDVWIHSEGHGPDSGGEATSSTYGWRIGSVFELVRAGVSAFRIWMEDNITKVRIGRENSSHVEITDSSVGFADKSGEVRARFKYVEWGEQPDSWDYELDSGQWQSGNGNACGFGEDLAYLTDGMETWGGLMAGWVKTGAYTFSCVRVAFADIGTLVTGLTEPELEDAFGSPHSFFNESAYYSYNLQFDANNSKVMVRRSYNQSTSYDVGYVDTDYSSRSTSEGRFALDTNLSVMHSAEDGVEHGLEVVDQSDNGRSLLFGVGTGQVNRGIYDRKRKAWLVHATDSGLYAGAINVTNKTAARRSLGFDAGSVTISASANAVTNATVTFSNAVSFSSAPIVVVGFFSSSTAAAFGGLACSVYDITTTGCKVRVFNNTSSARTPAIEWIAVGS